MQSVPITTGNQKQIKPLMAIQEHLKTFVVHKLDAAVRGEWNGQFDTGDNRLQNSYACTLRYDSAHTMEHFRLC